MGQKLSRGNEQEEISLNHTKFVQSRIIKSGQKQILKTAIPCDEKSFKLWKQVIEKHKSIEHKYLMLPLKNKFKSSAMCATRGSLELQFENYPYLLTDQIHNRKGKKVPFTEPQLWYLLYAYLSLKYYLKINFDAPYNSIGDVRPDNVFINQNGQVKFSCLLSWPGEKINYKKTFDGITTYLSPQDYELLNLGTMNNQANLTSQMFSIGLTLISAATLRENSDIYNVDKLKFDTHQATKRINTFKCLSIYSELLRAIIASFCQFQPKNRLDFNDLWLWITKYERRIMTKQSFMIEQIPQKINEHINRLRAELLSLQPSSSVFNLTSIRSLKSSQVKLQGFSQLLKQRSDIKYLKQADGKEFQSQIQNEKRKSRIVINPGQEHKKVFYSPTNGAYFSNKPQNDGQNMIGSPRVYKIDQQRSSINGFNRPVLNAGSPQYEAQKVMKSPEGYYSPKIGINKFRVFIQYKSPSKPIEKPFAQTVYLNKQGQQTGVMKVQSMDNDIKVGSTKRKNSDSQSQKSGKSSGSNRQNRFIEQTIRQSQQKKSQISRQKQKQQQNIRIEQGVYKKQSPIHQIIDLQNVNQAISEVVSQEVLMPKILKNKNDKEEEKKVELTQEELVDFNTSLNQMVVSKQKINQYQQQKVQVVLENVTVQDQTRLKTQQQINKVTFDQGKNIVIPDSQQAIKIQKQQKQISDKMSQTKQEIKDSIKSNHSIKSSPFDQIVDEIYPVNLQQVNHITEQIIQNEVSSQKQPQELHSINNKSHYSQIEGNNIIVDGNDNSNNNNILILDQPLMQEEGKRQEQIPTKEGQTGNNLYEVPPIVLQDRPLIPLGPQTHQHQNNGAQIIVKQQQVIEEKLQKKVLSPFEKIQLQQQQQQVVNKRQNNQVHTQQIYCNEVINKLQDQQHVVNEQSNNQGQQSGFHSSVIVERLQIQPVTVEIKELDLQEQSVNQQQGQDVVNQNIQLEGKPQYVINTVQNDEQTINNQQYVDHNQEYQHQQQHEDQHQHKHQDQQMNLKISYNVIEVQQSQQPLPNDVQMDSQIQGSGISHSLIQGKHQYLAELLQNNDKQKSQNQQQTNNYYDLQLLKNDLIDNNNNNDKSNALILNAQQLTSQNVTFLPKRAIDLLQSAPVQSEEQPVQLQQSPIKIQQTKKDQQQPQYQIIIEDIKQTNHNEKNRQINKGILPLQSNQKHQIPIYQLNLHENQAQTLKQINQHELIEAQYQPQPEELESNCNYQKQNQNHQQHQQPNQLHLSDNNYLQVTLPKAQLQSQFGNISQIMDINRQFDNTLNGKQRNLLQGTTDPKSQQMLKQLMNLSQKGIIHQADLAKVQMSNQDRDKLSNFMKRWQNYDPHHQSSNQAHHYIDQFKQAILNQQQQQNKQENNQPQQQQQHQPNYQHQQQDNRLHMSPQDKQKLRSIVQRLNKNNKNLFQQLQQRILANYDQSHVDIICSQMKTQIIQKTQNVVVKEQSIKQPQCDDVKVEEGQEKEDNHRLGRFDNKHNRYDIIDQVIQINNSLNKLKEQHQQQNQKEQQVVPLQNQNEIVPLQQQNYIQHYNLQNSEKFSLQANPETDYINIQQPLPKIITVANPKKLEFQQSHSFNPHLSQISQAIDQNQPFIIDQNIQNIEFKQTNGSHVHASFGQRSQRDDYIHDDQDIYRSNQHDSTNHDLRILKNHRTQSQPHDIFQRGTLSLDLSPRSNKPGRYIQNKDAITQEFLQNDQITDVLADQCFIQQSDNYEVSSNIEPFTLKEKDIIDEITQINHMITTQVDNLIQQPIQQVKETKVQQVPVVVEYPQSHIVKVQQPKPISRRKIFRKNDFLDDVMQVNKIINKEEDKDYYLNNKYLKEHKANQ